LRRTFEWPDASSVNTMAHSVSPLGLSDSDYWSLRPPSTVLDTTGAALLTETDSDGIAAAYPGLSLVSSNAQAQREPLPSPAPMTCASNNYVNGPPFELGIPGYMLLTPAKVACWHSHLKVIRRVADVRLMDEAVLPHENPSDVDAVSLILEDDIDMERDIHAKLREVWDLLPTDWDIVFLGIPFTRPIDSRTTLHPSFAPKCTHAYALTRTGARRLLLYLRHTPFAYSRALDQALSFSVVPSLIVQRKIGRSDIDASGGGMGTRT
ncbi:uncharacterized protein B0H18DRAFT_1024791, partial [Fomitopsis serialis]|uniref:uncharacterized protein n=1 Tax=Fomitopsis serialis TaxID=139415 RepID=UPI002007663D